MGSFDDIERALYGEICRKVSVRGKPFGNDISVKALMVPTERF